MQVSAGRRTHGRYWLHFGVCRDAPDASYYNLWFSFWQFGLGLWWRPWACALWAGRYELRLQTPHYRHKRAAEHRVAWVRVLGMGAPLVQLHKWR